MIVCTGVSAKGRRANAVGIVYACIDGAQLHMLLYLMSPSSVQCSGESDEPFRSCRQDKKKNLQRFGTCDYFQFYFTK